MDIEALRKFYKLIQSRKWCPHFLMIQKNVFAQENLN
jgi:hypothetical protein